MDKIELTKDIPIYSLNYEYIRTCDAMGLVGIARAMLNGEIDEQYSNEINIKKLLVDFIKNSKSLEKPEEKQNWFDLIPKMNNDQLLRLVEILGRENDKLSFIEDRFESKKLKIKHRFLTKWKEVTENRKLNDSTDNSR